LTSNRYSPRTQIVLYGIHPVQETLKAGRRRIDEIYMTRDPAAYREVAVLLKKAGFPLTRVSEREILDVAGSPHHQGIAARVGPFPYADFSDILTRWAHRPGFLLLLDEIQDPVNLGSILRSAECFGASAVILTRDHAAQITPVVEKASAGATAHIATARVVNLVRAIEQIKEAGYWVYAANSTSVDTLYSLDLHSSIAFVLGSEGKGIRRLVKEKCDGSVSIPMAGKIGSLNVSHAATILLAEFRRRQMALGGIIPENLGS